MKFPCSQCQKVLEVDAQWAGHVRPEGGGGDYGPNSGGFDQIGYGTLTFTLDSDAPKKTADSSR
jgi:hypothetical protein